MKPLAIDVRSEVPPFKQVVHGVLDAIARGELLPGDRVPSIRELAGAALVNPNTIAKAMRELTLLGAVQPRSGSGVFVTDAGPRLARRARGAATLAGFRTAVRAALASGHPAADLVEILAEVSMPAKGKSP